MKQTLVFTLLLIAVPFAFAAEAPVNLTIEQARELAIKTHPRITAAELQKLAAREEVKQARSSYLPTITANATAVGASDDDNLRITAGSVSNPAIFNREAEGVNISQIITDFGRTANLTASAKLHAGAEQANEQAVKDQIVLLVDTAYFDVLRGAALLNVGKQTVTTRQLLLDQVSVLASNKFKSELDVNFAKVNVDDARLISLQAENDLNAAQTRLATLLGYTEPRTFLLKDVGLPKGDLPEISDLVEHALKNRPDLEQLRLESESAARRARADRALNYPTLTAVGAAGISPIHDGTFDDRYAVGGVNLSIPIFEGGLYSARIKEAQLRAEASDALYRDRQNQVIRDVRVAWLSAQTAFERMHLTEELYQHAQRAYDLAEARYRAGGTSIVELSQAQLNKTSAEIARATAQFAYLTQLSILDFQTSSSPAR
jgi:outer membrane protein